MMVHKAMQAHRCLSFASWCMFFIYKLGMQYIYCKQSAYESGKWLDCYCRCLGGSGEKKDVQLHVMRNEQQLSDFDSFSG